MGRSGDDDLISAAFIFIGSYIVLSNNIFSLDSLIIFTITGFLLVGKIGYHTALEQCILSIPTVNLTWWIFETYDYESIIFVVLVFLHILLREREETQSEEEQAQSIIDEEDIDTDEEVHIPIDLRGLVSTLLLYLATILSTGHLVSIGITAAAVSLFFVEREYERMTKKNRPFKVTIVEGDITRQKVDVIISSTSDSMHQLSGTVAHSVQTAGGRTLNQEFNNKYPQGIKGGEIGETSGGDMPCQSVYHVNLDMRSSQSPDSLSFDSYHDYSSLHLHGGEFSYSNEDDENNEHEIKEVLCGVIKKCLLRASSKGKKSIAFPMLGTGVLDYSPDNVARCIFQTLDQFSTSHASTSIRDVRVVVLPSDVKNIKVLTAAKDDYNAYSTASTESGLPHGWNQMNDDEFYIRVPINFFDTEYATVANAFLSGTGNRYEIKQIERIQNKTLYFQYKMQKNRMTAENPGIVIERHLWHGTSENSVDSINVYGFSRSYTGKNATVYGEGSYFAVSPKYSARSTYSPPDKRGRRRMYMVAVLTGHYTTGCHGMRTPPPRDTSRPHLKYDTVVDSTSQPSMFVVFNDVQAYPEYLITFRKK